MLVRREALEGATMESDDATANRRGNPIDRRKVLGLIGSGAAWLAAMRYARAAQSGAAVPACIVRPQQIEGPFFVENVPERSDIRADPVTGINVPGAPLRLSFRVSSLTGTRCAPLQGAHVDVWHCDAMGRYSDTGRGSQSQGSFLRGYQRTDAAGLVQFLTIYPGWYGGRAVHVHFKIRTQAASGSAQEFTSQLYFDDALNDRVFAMAPYATRGRPAMRNADDFIFREGGRQLLLAATRDGEMVAAAFDIGLAL
jgi:protocatechuate 3,4-dioxygenase beta subunit